jgi:site-specific DNA recombinase
MPVAVYLRVSTEEQRERQSIQTQRDFAQRYCDLHQLPIHEMYADDGVSGTLPLHARPAGHQLLDDARHHRFQQLLVFKLDRLGRDTRLTLEAVAQLEACGVAVRSMTEEFDSQSASGRLMMTLLSGFATHEREVIRERSMAGTRRKAEAGAWLGGVVPYGYRKEGQPGNSRLAPSQQPLPGCAWSAAEVVRRIYGWCAEQQQSCQQIADELNRLHIPCRGMETDGQPSTRRRIAAVWRPSHVRNLIVSRTNMGQHVFGKRCRNGASPPIVRAVPALVAESVWQAAQRVLHAHRGGRACTASQPFLLRGLIHCGRCGLLYSGMRQRGPQPGHSYRCNGRQFAHALYGSREHQCAGKNLPGGLVDGVVWAEIQGFLRQSQQILTQLRQRVKLSEVERQRREQELADLRAQRREKGAERERMLGLFRRGRIDEATLDRHLDAIDGEVAALQAGITAAERALCEDERAAQLRAAEKLLGSLRAELDEPLTPVVQRQIVEALVDKIEVGTVERWGVPQSAVTVTYRFTPPASAEPLVLPLRHTLHGRWKVPEKAETVGDHLRRRRLELGLLQRQVAEQLGVAQGTMHNWEKNRCQPRVQHMPAVVRFLGYTPPVATDSWAARLVQGRRAIGLSQKEAARQMGVVQCTLARWERGEREPEGDYAARTRRFLQGTSAKKPAAAVAGRA